MELLMYGLPCAHLKKEFEREGDILHKGAILPDNEPQSPNSY